MEILGTIPQIFYDFISRVIPGAIIMVSVAMGAKLGDLSTQLWAGAPTLQNSVLFLGTALLICAYLVGQINQFASLKEGLFHV